MKTLALLTVSLALLASSTLGAAATIHRQHSVPVGARSVGALYHQLTSAQFLGLRGLVSRPHAAPAQAAATPTASPTPTGPTPTATATNTYPDPQVILRNSLLVLEQVTNVHYDQVYDGEQVQTAKLHIDIAGNATCTGPAMNGSASGSQTLEGTSQSSTFKASFVWIKNKQWIKNKSSHQRWAKASKEQISPFGFTVRFKEDLFPLPCGTGQLASLSRPAQNVQIKDLVNLGPDTFQGVAVWHIHGIIVTTDTSGNSVEIPFDFLISQDHYLPYVQSQTITDATNGITLTNKTVLTKFGTKVAVKKPKIGSTKP